ncbi:DUF7010 family protein [Alkaliflexus imshenetskii]|uniref:DUF7010 family protein n=1 Tax=Alkaliflexus imshenetskii TaxID=286730 RepID=UPI00047C9131|nr:hypothetical protein [Alkaliflexus imshenetskii]
MANINTETLDNLRVSLSIKAKNGIDFTSAAAIIWLLIAVIWKMGFSDYDKSVLTFVVGGFMLPLALLFSKLIKTVWTDKENPLQPLGLWLNFAQLFYFPFLIFTLVKFPTYFVMTYAIITGAHFFPYAWFYKTPLFAIAAGIISVGAMLGGFILESEMMFLIPLSVSTALILLSILLYVDSNAKSRKLKSEAS